MTKNKLMTVNQNVRGLRTKTNELFCRIQGLECDIIAITETWLNEGVYNAELFDQSFKVYRKDRNS